MRGREVGRVVGVYGSSYVRVAVREDRMGYVSRPGTYLKLEAGGCTLYGMVVGFSLVDEVYRYLRSPSYMEGYERLEPSRNEVVVALAGYRDPETGCVARGVPALPRPGSKAYALGEDEYRSLFSSGDLEIGRLVTCPSVPVSLDLNKLLTRHFAVLAMTGAGKSNLVAVLLAGILSRYPGSRILLVDTHSEYTVLHELARGMGRGTRLYRPLGAPGVEGAEDLELPYWLLGREELYTLLSLDSRATKQRMYLREALRSVRGEQLVDDPVYYRLEELMERVRRIRDSSAMDLYMKLQDLVLDKDVAFIARPRSSVREVEELIEEEGDVVKASMAFAERFTERLLGANLVILSLGGLPFDVQDVVVSTVLKYVWDRVVESKLRGVVTPILVVVEEAHLYASRHRWTSSRRVLARIAREGRKFGISLGLVSQRPREIDESVLSQCGNLMALRTVNPGDQKYILSSMEDVYEDLVTSLAGLETGEALIVGPAVTLPALARVHDFTELYRARLGGKDVDYRACWSAPSG